MMRRLGINEQEEAVYVELLRRRRAMVSDVAEALAVPLTDVTVAADRLVALGLATRDGSGLHMVVPPDVGLGTLIAQRQAALQQVQGRLAELVEVYRTGGASPAGDIEVLTTQEQLSTWIENMERGAKRELQVFFRPPYVLDVELDDSTNAAPAHRYVYERAALDDPRTPAEIGRFLKSGYEIRIAPELPSKMIIVDREAVLLPMMPGQTTVHPGFILVRGQSLVHLLVALFERVWQAATPLRLTAANLAEGVPAWDDFDVTLLTYLLSGMPDKAAASRLGTSERTVQRRMRRLMKLAGTDSRMQLAWYAAQSGMIPLGGDPNGAGAAPVR
ncbi:Sugar-specific transcriptional regulator TrmB [Nonomuraea coxensis DSM 45129]|uniref:Sugar-specific transcriptional regulator TrmB n=1 Tax=Nonomuraea coxensis DSM 45129 TaxID=1122611 RepID=A0ABX8TY04_9ACTN|nr:helix-turn-helix domain-containing protein [Nonomuraea coxensis]QYC40263.1 Sugar-specific transcriptional regulator TrmB [Nonomuraea coxensis DSM 45129]